MTLAQLEETGVLRFPTDFVWGTASAAYQIEGGEAADGRGPSIWDTYRRRPGTVHGGPGGDHYHRYHDDVALMADLGLRGYRFSISWPRVRPDGRATNHTGLAFYDRLVDSLCAAGITPMATLYHWDLPQALEDTGGWTVRDTAERFAEYAAVVHARLGDRVPSWTTLNEPWSAAFLGYAAGIHAPGRRDPAAGFAAVHHLLLGHGLATRALRAGAAGEVCLVLDPVPVSGLGSGTEAAVRLVDGLRNRLFLDPVLRGRYPEDVLAVAARFTDLGYERAGDLDTIRQPPDTLGITYYEPMLVGVGDGPSNPAYPGSEGVRFLRPDGPRTATGLSIRPDGLTAILERIAADHPGVPLLVAGNGAAFPDRVVDGRVADPDRISYLDGHLRAAYAALRHGVDLRGYLVWSLLDATGRDGIVYVDHTSRQRLLKDSARWYQQVIEHGGLPLPGYHEEHPR